MTEVKRAYDEDALIRALMTFAAMYLACDSQEMVDHVEHALDLLVMAPYEKELR